MSNMFDRKMIKYKIEKCFFQLNAGSVAERSKGTFIPMAMHNARSLRHFEAAFDACESDARVVHTCSFFFLTHQKIVSKQICA